MKLEKWARIAEIVGGVAIVVTLITLILEMRMNTQELRIANTTAAVQFFNDWRADIASDEEMADIWVRGRRGDELTEVETERYERLCGNIFWANILMYERFRALGEAVRAAGPITQMRAALEQYPGAQDCWFNAVRAGVVAWGYDEFINAVEAP